MFANLDILFLPTRTNVNAIIVSVEGILLISIWPSPTTARQHLKRSVSNILEHCYDQFGEQRWLRQGAVMRGNQPGRELLAVILCCIPWVAENMSHSFYHLCLIKEVIHPEVWLCAKMPAAMWPQMNRDHPPAASRKESSKDEKSFRAIPWLFSSGEWLHRTPASSSPPHKYGLFW